MESSLANIPPQKRSERARQLFYEDLYIPEKFTKSFQNIVKVCYSFEELGEIEGGEIEGGEIEGEKDFEGFNEENKNIERSIKENTEPKLSSEDLLKQKIYILSSNIYKNKNRINSKNSNNSKNTNNSKNNKINSKNSKSSKNSPSSPNSAKFSKNSHNSPSSANFSNFATNLDLFADTLSTFSAIRDENRPNINPYEIASPSELENTHNNLVELLNQQNARDREAYNRAHPYAGYAGYNTKTSAEMDEKIEHLNKTYRKKNFEYIQEKPCEILGTEKFQNYLINTYKNILGTKIPYNKLETIENLKFQAILPKNGKDLMEEGGNLHHCVGGYISKITDKKTNIIFIREVGEGERAGKEKESLVTVEVGEDKVIRQIHLKYNAWLGTRPEIIPFVLEWIKEKELICDDNIIFNTGASYSGNRASNNLKRKDFEM